jgi:hypothetical protein
VREMRLIRLNAKLPQIKLMARARARPIAKAKIKIRARTMIRIIIN